MIYYEICNLYEEHYNKYLLIGRLKASNFLYFGILHNRDYFPTGEPKKAHFHLILGVNEDNKKAKSIVSDFFNDDSIIIRNVRNPKGYARYLTHKDNLEKAQYKDNEVFTNDYNLYEELTQVNIKMSNTDNLLVMLKNYILSDKFDFNNLDLTLFEWFESKGKLDYYIKNKIRLKDYVLEVVDLFIKKEG